ncbi:MAG: HYR domain-containing protein, partial [Bacteroidia bacterium]|nr:HYR domain-containing protein [Bacteroidia bacterium]
MKQTYLFISLFLIVLSLGFASNSEIVFNTTDNSEIVSEKNYDYVAVANCQNIVVQLNASGTVSIAEDAVNNGSIGTGVLTFDTDVTSFTCSDIGDNTVTLTVTDTSDGSTDSCTATVTVEDNISPTVSCPGNITVNTDPGSCTAVVNGLGPTNNDNCGVVLRTWTLSGATTRTSPGSGPGVSASGQVFNLGVTTVTYYVEDAAGNSGTCSMTVTVVDNEAPNVICQDITIQLDNSGNAAIISGDVDGGSTDACGIASFTVTPSSFTCADVGNNNVTLTVTDNNGNSANCNAIVTVQDNTSPDAKCTNLTIQLDASGNASVTAAQVDDGSSDNCGIASLSLSQTAFTCADVGNNTVTLTVTDDSGNTDSCNATITVQDNIDPTVLCQNITVQLNASGNATITAAQIDNGSNDNCGIASMTINKTVFDCGDIGPNNVTLTVTDVNGNNDTCLAIVTVQ